MTIGVVDRSLEQGGFWERATFTVPSDVPDERVQARADKYTAKAAKVFEAQGCTILNFTKPFVSLGHLVTDDDRRRYDIFFWCRREPINHNISVPAQLIPEFQSKGWKLN